MRQKKLEIILLGLALAVSTGCRREEIRVYVAPKDPPPPEMAAHSPHDGHNHEHGEERPTRPRPRPKISYALPAGWQEDAPGPMSAASFSITNAAGKEAEISITPLGMLAGREADVVNMFRERVGLKPLADDEVRQQLRDVQVGKETGKLFEIAGGAESNSPPQRIVTAIVHRSDASWFYRLSGDDALVQAQRDAFVEFLKTIAIEQPAAPESERAASQKKWTVPGEWTELPPKQMTVARFAVPAKNGAGAEVSVSVFGNATGGTLANINRWRSRVQLPDITSDKLPEVVQPLEGVPDGLLTDLKNQGQQLLGAIVPRDGQYWFYKLEGSAEAVAPQRDNFVRFVKSNP